MVAATLNVWFVEGVPSVVLNPESAVGLAKINGPAFEETVVIAPRVALVDPLAAVIALCVGPPGEALLGMRAKTVLLRAPFVRDRTREVL